eukprot:TRINITY_DN1154_c1_g1_i1.p1 TRINITY_DN1154_c1_g1~~TRINITY_DN1154_c1_g1_i1.p1  ORF type:complete len:670 (+),score=187.24 TRINITY_DN1154_c1_g1_i1:69-2012(+)
MFSKMTSDRFQLTRNTSSPAVGPGSYDIPTTLLDVNAPSIGHGLRFHDNVQAPTTPGPGAYYDVADEKEMSLCRTPRAAEILPGGGSKTPRAAVRMLRHNDKENHFPERPRGGVSFAHKAELESLRAKLAQSEAQRAREAEALRARVAELEATRSSAEELLASKASAQRMQEELEEHRRDRSELLRRAEGAELALCDADRRIRAAEEQGRRASDSREAADREAERLSRKLEASERRASSFEERLSGLREKMDGDLIETRNNLEEMRATTERLEGSHATLEARCDRYREAAAELWRRGALEATQHAATMVVRDASAKALARLLEQQDEQSMRQHQAALLKAREEVRLCNEAVAASRTEAAETTGTLSRCQEELDAATRRLRHEETCREELEGETQRLRSNLDLEATRLQTIEAQNQELVRTLQLFQRDMSFLNGENDELRKQVDAFQDFQDRLEAERAVLSGHANHQQKIKYVLQLKEENTSLRAELKKARQRASEFQLGSANLNLSVCSRAISLEGVEGKSRARSRLGSAQSDAELASLASLCESECKATNEASFSVDVEHLRVLAARALSLVGAPAARSEAEGGLEPVLRRLQQVLQAQPASGDAEAGAAPGSPVAETAAAAEEEVDVAEAEADSALLQESSDESV